LNPFSINISLEPITAFAVSAIIGTFLKYESALFISLISSTVSTPSIRGIM
jgi:hypothetical protein